MLEKVQWADWAPDGSSFVVVREENGQSRSRVSHRQSFLQDRRLDQPPAHLSEGRSDCLSRSSRSSRRCRSVYLTRSFRQNHHSFYGWGTVWGLAWAPSGEEVWFTGSKIGYGRYLTAVSLKGKERLLTREPGTLTIQDIGRNGQVILTRDVPRVGMVGLASGESKERDLSWLDWSAPKDLSADGKTLLFTESGEAGGENYSSYLRETDGSPAVRLGDGFGFALSPDKKFVLGGFSGLPFS